VRGERERERERESVKERETSSQNKNSFTSIPKKVKLDGCSGITDAISLVNLFL